MLSDLIKKKMPYENFIQTISFKPNASTVFLDGRLQNIESISKEAKYMTWEPIPDIETESALLYAGGKHFSEFLSDYDKDLYRALEQKREAYMKSFVISKLDITKAEIIDLMPESYLHKLFDLKNKATHAVLSSFEKPPNYDFLEDEYALLSDISFRRLNLKRNDKFKDNSRYQKIFMNGGIPGYICYDMFRTVTGRLSIVPKTFPILNLDKEIRDVLHPTNDIFVDLDYNSAEVRILNVLSGKGLEEDDIHSWMAKNIFNIEDRGESKKQFFSWLYNPLKANKELDSFYQREKLLEKYYKNGTICTPFNREIECGEFHALNYLLQSTSSDLTMESAIKINKMLKGLKSFVAFTVHDSMVLDMAYEDFKLLKQLKEAYENTKLGHMKTNVSVGKTYGSMQEAE